VASIEKIFVSLPSATGRRLPVGSNPCQGIWYRANNGAAPRAAFIATHYSADMSEHYLAEPLAARGFGFLGWNTRYRGAEDTFALEHALLDIAAGIQWLREHQRIETIILFGNSGGGSLMAIYQSQAAKGGLAVAAGAAALPDELGRLPAGDLFISLNSHLGRPEYLRSIIDPSVVSETDPIATDASLDMYDEANGPPFSLHFVERYRAAQEARMMRISAWAVGELERLKAHGHSDRIFSVPRVWADLRYLDPNLDPSDRPMGLCYAGRPAQANRGAAGVARALTLKTWLDLWSLEHSQCRADWHMRNVEIPSLIVQSLHDVGVFPSDARAIHHGIGAADKQIAFIPGSHFLENPELARIATADLLADWLRGHHAQ
jgi:pimeloyl-ACP methyl ester carboxylesterase